MDEAPADRRRLTSEGRAKLAMTLAMWGASVSIFTVGSLLSGSSSFVGALLVRIAMAMLGLAFCYGLHRLLRHLAHRPFRFRAIMAVCLAPLVAEVFAWVNYFAVEIRNGRPIQVSTIDWLQAAQVLSLWTWFFVAWTGLYLAIEYSFEARREAERAAELRTMAQDAKLRALSSQINPHLLFNSLNSISALIMDRRPDEAERMLAELSKFFRSTLAIDPMTDIALGQEFDVHRRYLAIEQMRYPDLEVEVDLPSNVHEATVPALILQPLVENAVKHGVAKSLPPTRIRLSAERSGDALCVRVANFGTVGDITSPEGVGIGLANVRQRLAEYFGEAQALHLRSLPDGFEARVDMPLTFR